MPYFLLKTEPETYSYDDLVADKSCVWDGVANAAALKNIRDMKEGDSVFVYHTGGEKQIVGVAIVTKSAYADPKLDDEKMAVIDLKPSRKLDRPVTLAEIKADKAFADWELVRIGRLSVMPVPPALWKRIETLAKS